jgi:hypothetical protein
MATKHKSVVPSRKCVKALKEQSKAVTQRDPVAVECGELFVRSRKLALDAIKMRLEIGHKLIVKRREMKHGEWQPWLEANEKVLGFGGRTARRLMVAAEKWSPASLSKLDELGLIEVSREMWDHKTVAAEEEAKANAEERAEIEAERAEEKAQAWAAMKRLYPDFNIEAAERLDAAVAAKLAEEAIEEIVDQPVEEHEQPKLPTAEEANAEAKRTGKPVLARDGYYYFGASKEEAAAYEATVEKVYTIRRAIEDIAKVDMTPEQFISYMEPHQRWKTDEEIDGVEHASQWLCALAAAIRKPKQLH